MWSPRWILVASLVGCDSDLLIDGPVDWLGAPIGYDDAAAQIQLKVAAVAMASGVDKDENVQQIVATIDALATDDPGVRVIVFPEVATGHYWLEGDHTGKATAAYMANDLAEPVPGPTTDAIGAAAAASDVWVLVGVVERDDDALYDSAVLIGPDGAVVATHRKLALLDSDRAAGFTAGDLVTFADIDGVKTALTICHDTTSASVARQIVDGGAQLVLTSVADETGVSFLDLDRGFARAWDAWTVWGNKAGTEGDYWMKSDTLDFAGAVGVVTPTGFASERQDLPSGGFVTHTIGVYAP